MISISDQQLAAIGNARLSDFLERSRLFISSRLSRPVGLHEVSASYKRGQMYGLQSEQDFVRYMLVSILIKAPSEPEDPDWMQAILGNQHSTAERRSRQLFDESERHISRGSATGDEQ